MTEVGAATSRVADEAQRRSRLWRDPKIVMAAASGALFLVGWLLSASSAPDWISSVFFVLAMIVGGYFFGREAVGELVFERKVGIELLMSVAAIAATLAGEVLEGAMLVFLYSISEAAEGYTEEKTRSSVRALMKLAPKVALVKRGGEAREIPVEAIEVGDTFIVRPGEAVATDGTIAAGSSAVNEAPVTGESVPVDKLSGDAVFAGTVNGDGALEVVATKTFADNTIARIIHMVEEAQENKGAIQRFVERFGNIYSPIVLALAVGVAVVPPLVFGASWETWVMRATVFVVAAAPCALVISIPITLVATLGTAARNGVLIKGGMHVEDLAKIRVVAFDKTGTVTYGVPSVTDVVPCDEQNWQQTVALAAGVEERSGHPLARAILRYARREGISPADMHSHRALPGAGAVAVADGMETYVGSPTLFKQELRTSVDSAAEDIARLQSEGKTVILIGTERGVRGLIALQDQVRSNAAAAVEALHDAGVAKVVMLTGDNEPTARTIAAQLGIDEVHANMKPENKLSMVRELNSRYGQVAMVGDGVNDAPALAEALVGVAMGAAGTDVALETADVALMADDLEKLAYALKLARRNQTVVGQNLALSGVVVGLLVIGALGGLLTLPAAVLAHEISEFVVIASGLRMLRS